MHGAHQFLEAITIVLCVAAVTTILFQRLRQPVVLGYILAGLIVGPHVPIPLVADREIVETLSELGVILLMFSLGLEFSVRKLLEVGPTTGLTAIIQSSVMVWLGYLAGQAFGWTSRESLFAGAIVAISSTTIIARAFDEQGVKGSLREFVVGVLVVEDLIAVLLMAILTALSSGDGVSVRTIVESGARLLAFLVGLVAVGMLVVPRTIRAINRLERPETTLVASVGLCFAVALLARAFGYSAALGAFIAGSLVAESGEAHKVEHRVLPVRDLFAAMFFVSVGMMIDPALVARHAGAVGVFTALVLGGKFCGVALGAFLTGSGTRTAVKAGLSLAQIGEFSFIIAALGISLGATRDFLYPLAVAVSAITTLTTPWLIRAADPAANLVDRKLPRPLQTFSSLYGTWLERLRTSEPADPRTASRVRRLAKLLVVDASALAALVMGASLATPAIAERAARQLGVGRTLAEAAVVVLTLALALPLVGGIVRIARGLGLAMAEAAFPEDGGGRLDRASAPRRAMVVTVQLAVVLVVALPLLAFTQPFLPSWAGAVPLGALLGGLAVVFWRNATNLQGHVTAGAAVIAEALLAQADARAEGASSNALEPLDHLLPGLGAPAPLRLGEHSAAVGRTLADLDLRGRTGASVLALARGEAGAIVPAATEALRAGDVLALAGTREAIASAVALLQGVPLEPSTPPGSGDAGGAR